MKIQLLMLRGRELGGGQKIDRRSCDAFVRAGLATVESGRYSLTPAGREATSHVRLEKPSNRLAGEDVPE